MAAVSGRIKEKAGKFKALNFGTSGLRDTVENLTDMEVYINTRGFVLFLKERGEAEGGSKIAVGGDLRPSTPRIMAAVIKAIEDSGCKAVNCGAVPSPTLANYALRNGIPSIMVTGSHIPADRNGIKFTKKSGEVLKADEVDILRSVNAAREREYSMTWEEAIFNGDGSFKRPEALPSDAEKQKAVEMYDKRYTDVFPADSLAGKKIVVYQHSAVGRDILTRILKDLGAEVVAAGRTDEFTPVDTEKVSETTDKILQKAAREHKPDAIVSLDGDSDRPLLADEHGKFLPGDKLGALVSMFLRPDFAAVPVSANPAVIKGLQKADIEVKQTRIGSPYVIAAMNAKLAADPKARVVSWESNGGFLLGSDWNVDGKILPALPTRDAVLPLVSAVLLSKKEGMKLSELIDEKLPPFYTAAGVIDNKDKGAEEYTAEMGRKIIEMFSPSSGVESVSFDGDKVKSAEGAALTPEAEKELVGIKKHLERYFSAEKGFGYIESVNFVDGIRMTFITPGGKEEISHIRPSGNAPEFRNYAAADTEERAQEIADMRYRIVPEMVRELKG